MGSDDHPRQCFDVVAAHHEFPGEIVQQLGVRRFASRPIVSRFHQAEAHVALPDSIDRHLREAFILRRNHVSRYVAP